MGSTAEYLIAEYSTDALTAVRQALHRMLLGETDQMLALLANDVALVVAVGADSSECLRYWGKQAVVNYFGAMGGMMTSWQMDYASPGSNRLVAWGKEEFTIEPCGIEASSEYALVFNLSEGLITRVLVIEDLPSFIPPAPAR